MGFIFIRSYLSNLLLFLWMAFSTALNCFKSSSRLFLVSAPPSSSTSSASPLNFFASTGFSPETFSDLIFSADLLMASILLFILASFCCCLTTSVLSSGFRFSVFLFSSKSSFVTPSFSSTALLAVGLLEDDPFSVSLI